MVPLKKLLKFNFACIAEHHVVFYFFGRNQQNKVNRIPPLKKGYLISTIFRLELEPKMF